MAILSVPALNAVDFSDARLKSLGTDFNAAAKKLDDLSKKETCNEADFTSANSEAITINKVKADVNGVVNDLNLEILRVQTDLTEIQEKLNPESGQKPISFMDVIVSLMSKPDVIAKEDIERLVTLVNSSMKVSFVDSNGKRRFANNSNRKALDTDLEAKAVLLNVGLSLLTNDKSLKSFNYGGGEISDKNSLRLSNSKTKEENMFFLSDLQSASLSEPLKMLTLYASPSIEALPLGFNNKDNGAQAVRDELANIKKLVDVPALTKVLSEVRASNKKKLDSKTPSKEEADVLVIKAKKLEQELVAMNITLDKWKKLSTNLDMPTVSALMDFKKCEAAYTNFNRETKPKKVDPAHGAKSKADEEDLGVLKGVLK